MKGPNGKPRVLLLHPHGFSQRDMQFYLPLLEEFDVLAVTPKWRPNQRTYQGIPQSPQVSLDQVLGAIPIVQTALDRLVRLRSENLYYYFGLDPLFATADIVECLETFHPYCWQALRGKEKHGFRLAFSCHENIAFAHENLKIRRDIKRDAFAQGDAFFALCEQGRNSLLLEGAPADRVFLSGASIDTDLYAPGDSDPALLNALGLPTRTPDREPVLFLAGRLVWEKGIFDAVEALGLLSRRGISARLLIAGDGPEAGAIRIRAARMGITDRVNLLGKVSLPQMIALYRYADLCLVPSNPTSRWQEQFGCVLIEAMGCGCPVVATDSGSIREVTGGHAALVPPAHHTYLADTLAELLADAPRRQKMSQGGRDWVVQRYDNHPNAERIRTVYRGMLEGRIAAPAPTERVPA